MGKHSNFGAIQVPEQRNSVWSVDGIRVKYFWKHFPFSRVPLHPHKESPVSKTGEHPLAYVDDIIVQNSKLGGMGH